MSLLLVVGGGTGGHVFPGVAIAEAWTRRGGEVVYVGSPAGMESGLVPALGFEFVPMKARRLKNAGAAERARSLLSMPGAIWAGRRLINRLNPAVVLGVGGYVSGPVVLAAALSGRPCAIAEQNARAGLTNRILARFVKRVYSAFPQIAEQLPAAKVRLLGNPVRQVIRDAAAKAAPPGQSRRVLVLGGSQGARALNELAPPALAMLKRRFPDLEVRHQAGRGKDEAARKAYDDVGFEVATVEAFIDDMAGAIAWADLVLARAGATTVAELACIGRPAFFVPFPFAADDHQAANAQSLVEAGGALMERESTLTVDGLAHRLGALLDAPEILAAMGRKTLACGRPNAADAIVDDLEDLARAGDR